MMLLLFMLNEVLTELTFGNMGKNNATSVMGNSNLIDKKGVL